MQTSDAIPRARGPGSDRLGAMRDAFKSQYMSQFTASEDTTWEKTNQKSDYGVVKANTEGRSGNRGGNGGSSGRGSNSSGGTTLSSGTYIGGAPMKSSGLYSGFVAQSSSSNDGGSDAKSDSKKKRSRWDTN